MSESVVIKALLGFIGGLVALVWTNQGRVSKENREEIRKINEKLDKDYHNKESISLIVTPLVDSVNHQTESTKKLTEAVQELRVELASRD